MDYAKQYQEYLARANQALEKACETFLPEESEVCRAARYSLLGGGKRIRAVLVLAVCDMLNGSAEAAEQFAAAVEMLHCYSLIHDDLPCMDDDDLRRGKPTNHKVYGETLAVLAGDALQPAAYRLILTAPGLTDVQRADCALILANASGPDGMVAGQVLDTLHHPSAQDELTEVHHLKTGAMIAGACMLGVGAAGGSEAARKAAETYGYQLGLAFQIRDDMLDVIGNADEFGKPIGSDKDEGKVTYVDRLGLDDCGKLIHELTEQAVSAVSDLDRDGFLTALAESLTERMK